MQLQQFVSALAGSLVVSILSCQSVLAHDFHDEVSACKLKSYEREDFDHLHNKDVFKLPKEDQFCFEHDSLYWYNFARFDFSDTFQDGRLDYQEDNDDMAAVGGVVGEEGVTKDFHIAYLTVKPKSHVHFFNLHSFRFFCMKYGIPVECTIGVVTSRGMEDMPGDKPLLYRFSPPDSYPFVPQTAILPHERSHYLRFVAVGLPVVNFGQRDVAQDAAIYSRTDTHGITMYIDDLTYSRWKCTDETPDVVLNGTMTELGFGECHD